MLTGFFMSHSVVTSELLYEIFISPFYYDLNYNQAPQLLLESLKRYLDSLGPVCLWTIYESVVITSTIDVLLKAGLATLLEADELS